jgi:hypothetical protein
LTPPNGAFALSIAHALTVTWPDSSALLTRCARFRLLVKIAALRPCRVSFALRMTSSSDENLAILCHPLALAHLLL